MRLKRFALKELVKLLLELALSSSTYELVDELTILKEQDSRDIAYTILHGDILIGLDVALADDDLAVILVGKFLHDRTYHTARTAPCGPQINDKRLVAILQLLEIISCYFYCHNYFPFSLFVIFCAKVNK